MKNPFGLDIGSTTMKLVSLIKSHEKISLDAAVTAPVPPKGMISDSILDMEEMSQAIKSAVEKAQIKGRSVNVALPETNVYTKVIEMPILSDKELSSAIYWEAEQYIPVPLPSVRLVWTVLYRPKHYTPQEKMQVLMVGAPTSIIKKYQQILGSAGLEIAAMETEIVSIVRAVAYGQTTLPPSLIVNIGSISTSLAIVKDSIMVFVFSVPTGGKALSKAISVDFGVSEEEADKYKMAYGVLGEGPANKLGKATKPILSSIILEIKKALAFYSQRYPKEKAVKQILLTGGTAKLPGIESFFAQESGIETAIANPWRNILGNSAQKELLANAPDYATAIGLALRDD